MRIISRAEWGAKPWRSGYSTRPLSRLNRVLIHYHGGKPRNTSGVGVPREIEGIHLANGWSGVGYHFIVSQAGEIFEGRGWELVGAHCPGHNTDGLGIYIGVGGDQEPTAAALAAARWLYDEACRRTGKQLTKSYHGYDYPTACPGPHLIAWVKAGMPVKGGATLEPLEEQEWRPTGDWSTKDVQALVGATVDGQYGPATEAAVRDLQAALDLTPDGLWGPTTEGAVVTILEDIQADLKAIKTTQTAHTAAIADVERWTRQGVNNALYAGPNKVLAGVASVLADTQGVDVDKLAAAIAEQIRDDVSKAGSGATAEQIADVLAKRLAG